MHNTWPPFTDLPPSLSGFGSAIGFKSYDRPGAAPANTVKAGKVFANALRFIGFSLLRYFPVGISKDMLVRGHFERFVPCGQVYSFHLYSFHPDDFSGPVATGNSIRTENQLERLTGALLDKCIKHLGETVDTTNRETFGLVKAMKTSVSVSASVAIVLGFVLAFAIARGITRPLKRVTEAMSAGAEEVASASGQISQSSQQLAEGATTQASSLEESSSALEELSSQFKGNAETARKANDLMVETLKVVDETGKAMDNMVETMGGILESVR